jgi:membrane protease YdiL (CAAX protease family)
MLSEKPWPPERILQLLIRLFASMLIGLVLVNWINTSSWFGSAQAKFLTLVVGTLSFHGVALILTQQLLHDEGLSWEDAFGFLRPRLGHALLLAVVVAMAVVPIAWALGELSARIMSVFHVQRIVQGPIEMLQSASSVPMKLLIGFLAIVIAPVVEEIVFRGLIYPTLKQNGLPGLALWGTSVLFAVIHNNLEILLPLTFLAVVLTLLYETTDNLLAPILTHSVFNFVNFFWVVAQSSPPATVWQT